MNREIKFRFWDYDHMGYDVAPVFKQTSLNGGIKSLIDSGYILMQYTRLKDKNGIEIYEGDILSEENRCAEDNVYVCEYVEAEAKYVFVSPFDGETLEQNDFACDLVIIGNIYQHPELLTTK